MLENQKMAPGLFLKAGVQQFVNGVLWESNRKVTEKYPMN